MRFSFLKVYMLTEGKGLGFFSVTLSPEEGRFTGVRYSPRASAKIPTNQETRIMGWGIFRDTACKVEPNCRGGASTC
jgi:hypothetical protein